MTKSRKADQGEKRNLHRVPGKQWRKWSEKARVAFNWLYSLMMNNPDLFNHPDSIKQKPAHWKTVAWNSAWLCADAVDEALPAR